MKAQGIKKPRSKKQASGSNDALRKVLMEQQEASDALRRIIGEKDALIRSLEAKCQFLTLEVSETKNLFDDLIRGQVPMDKEFGGVIEVPLSNALVLTCMLSVESADRRRGILADIAGKRLTAIIKGKPFWEPFEWTARMKEKFMEIDARNIS